MTLQGLANRCMFLGGPAAADQEEARGGGGPGQTLSPRGHPGGDTEARGPRNWTPGCPRSVRG